MRLCEIMYVLLIQPNCIRTEWNVSELHRQELADGSDERNGMREYSIGLLG
jgi:hypothetical protein